MIRQFRELLYKNHHHPMAQQKQLLEDTLRKWMNGHSQIDDILVFGARY
ncbi:MAG: hypothetical protein HC880_09025 [Bacteroidia bacterium]|nr:hypothetical protein [Bacteroidia bacterium]